MKWFKLIAATMLVWGNAALADLPASGDDLGQQLQTIKSWTAHLNLYHRDLKLKASDNIHDDLTAKRTLKDLETLENILQGDLEGDQAAGDPGVLMNLTCSNPVCFSDGD